MTSISWEQTQYGHIARFTDADGIECRVETVDSERLLIDVNPEPNAAVIVDKEVARVLISLLQRFVDTGSLLPEEE